MWNSIIEFFSSTINVVIVIAFFVVVIVLLGIVFFGNSAEKSHDDEVSKKPAKKSARKKRSDGDNTLPMKLWSFIELSPADLTATRNIAFIESNQDEIYIGRSSGCDLVLKSGFVGREQAVVYYDDTVGDYCIKPLGKNGKVCHCIVNGKKWSFGKRITMPEKLQNNTILVFADTPVLIHAVNSHIS